jgi:Sec-independent protein translocase protein TatA
MRFGVLELLLISGVFMLIFGTKRISVLKQSLKKCVKEYHNSQLPG